MTPGMADRMTSDHREIRRWVEAHGGRPAAVRGKGDDDAGVLRIDFPGGAGEEFLEPISYAIEGLRQDVRELEDRVDELRHQLDRPTAPEQ
jgi:hypothetical protein